MSFDASEKAGSGALPWEIYLFETEGEAFRLTSSDLPITYLGETYVPTTITRTELEHTAEVISGQIKVTLPVSHPLAALFVPYLPPSPMTLTIYGGHFGDSEVVTLFSGEVASAKFTDECEFTCNSDAYLLQRQVPKKLYQSGCSHVFGDSGCGVNLALYTQPGTVSAVDETGTIVTVPAFAGMTHSLRGGYFTRGDDVRMIIDHTGDVITLLSGIASLEAGDECSAVSGCQHTYAACASFNNVQNFMGFDLIPSINPFSGSIN